MIPVLYPTTETEFASNGIGHLNDAITCTITEERNGAFELEMQYPISGNHFKDIGQRSLILAKPSVLQDPQPFRVYKISKPINGVCTINAEHISYDLSGIPIASINATSCGDAISQLETASSGWSFWTDIVRAGNMRTYVPCSVRSLLGGTEGSMLDVYGGEWKWNKFLCQLYATRGTDRGVSIRYGKNLTDLTQEENCANLFTAVLCYWHKEENGVHTCIQGTKNVTDVFPSRTYLFSRTLIVDVSSEYEEQPTQATLQSRAETYIRANNVGVPSVSLTVSFVMLGETEEYKDLHLLEDVELCDTVSVKFEQLGVDAKAQVYKTSYNVLLDRYDSIELGDARTDISDTIADQQYALDHNTNEVTMDMMEQAISEATSAITGNTGGYVVMRDVNNDGKPDEILIMDTDDIATATKVWRWNSGGLGYSSTGVDGTYSTAITSDGEVVADFITTGTLSANRVRAGVLTDNNGVVTFDLTSANLKIMFNSVVDAYVMMDAGGISFYRNGVKCGSISNFENRGGTTYTNTYFRLRNTVGTVIGQFWDNGRTYSQLDLNRLHIRKGTDMNTDYTRFGFDSNDNAYNVIGGTLDVNGNLNVGDLMSSRKIYLNGVEMASGGVEIGSPSRNSIAFIVVGNSSSGHYYSTLFVPQDEATDHTWQIADDDSYTSFSLSSSGSVSGKSGSGSISVYGLNKT